MSDDRRPLVGKIEGERVVVVEHFEGNLYMGGEKRAAPVERPRSLPPRNEFFAGREKELLVLAGLMTRELRAGVTCEVATTADGGVGKTSLVLEYAWRHVEEYPGGVFWLHGETTALAPALAQFAAICGLPERETPEATAAAFKAHIESGPAALIVIDNLADAALLRSPSWGGLLPGGSCRHLVTTRLARVAGCTMHRLDRLDADDGRALLACHRRDADDPANAADVQAIAEWCDGLAIALTVIGAYMALHDDLAWRTYRGSLEKRGLTGLRDTEEDVDGGVRDYRSRLDAVLDDALAALPPAEHVALGYAALMPADTAGEPWLVAALEKDGTALPSLPGYEDRPALAVVESAVRRQLLRRAGAVASLLALHRVLRRRIEEVDAPLLARRLDVLSEIAVSRAIASKAALTDPTLRWELAPLARWASTFDAAGRRTTATQVANHVSWPLRDLGRFAEARDVLEPLCQGDDAALGGGDPDAATAALSNLALILKALGDATGARDRMQRSVAMCEKRLEADDPRLAVGYSNLATILSDLGDVAGARERMERAVAILLKRFGPDNPYLSIAYSNLATILQQQGDLAGARARIEQAIKIDEACLPADHPNLAVRYSNLATILQDSGDVKGARRRLEQAIAIEEKCFPPDHPNLAVRYSNLASILRDLGDFAGARGQTEKAIAIEQKHFPPDHPNLAVRYSNLATLLEDAGDLVGARQWLERAIAIEEKRFAPDHPNLAVRYSNLSTILQNSGDLKGAREWMERAIAIEEKHFPPDHPNLAVRYSNLATILQSAGDLVGARARIEQAIAIEEKAFAGDHPNLAIRYGNLAMILDAGGDRAGACVQLRKAKAVAARHFAPEHATAVSINSCLKGLDCGTC